MLHSRPPRPTVVIVCRVCDEMTTDYRQQPCEEFLPALCPAKPIRFLVSRDIVCCNCNPHLDPVQDLLFTLILFANTSTRGMLRSPPRLVLMEARCFMSFAGFLCSAQTCMRIDRLGG